MIEAVNKTLKYRWLYCHRYPDSLESHLPDIIKEYNVDRPHSSLNGLTPLESFRKTVLDKKKISLQMEKARINRLEVHRVNKCPVC